MLLILLNIIGWLEEHQLPCLFKTAFHFDCPGCGMQRSLVLFLKGDIINSFKMYPALVPIILLFGFLILHLSKKINSGTTILKYLYFFCAGIILLSYIYKIINH